MKKIVKLIIPLLFIALTMTVCDDGGSGGGGTSTGTFTKEVTYGGVLASNGAIFSTNIFRHYQMLYHASDIAGSGNIKSLYFKYFAANAAKIRCPHVTIKLAHTSLTDLNTTDMNLNINQGKGSAVTVLDDTTVTIPAGDAGDYFEIPLSRQFYYNGVDNLVIDILRMDASSGDLFITREPGSPVYTSMVYSTLSATPDTPDGNSQNVLHTKFGFAGGDNKVDLIPLTDSQTQVPFATDIDYNKSQILYTKESIAGSGLISGIGFQIGVLTTEQTYTYTIKLGHSTKTILDTTWENNFNAGRPVTVADAVEFTIPAGIPVGGFLWLPIPDGSFTYNGRDNLLVELTVNDFSSASNVVLLEIHPTTNINYLYGSPANSTADASSASALQIALRFYGATVDQVIGIGGFDSSRWFNTSVTGGVDQYLYLASELGTGGKITRIACRIVDSYAGPTTSTSYTNFNVVMSNTTARSLVVNYDTNVPSPVTVHSGTFSLPAGLNAGDWVEIPLKKAFTYDHTRNLVIQVKSDGGANAVPLSVLSDTARFPDRRASGINRSSASGSLGNVLKDIRLWISK